MKQERINIRVTESLKSLTEYAATLEQKSVSEYITDLIKKDVLTKSINIVQTVEQNLNAYKVWKSEGNGIL